MKKIVLTALLLVVVALPVWALDIGDTAPEITPETWVTGEAADPTQVDGTTFYLVEVWSVTCPPCVQSIPILNDLQSRYADQGFKIVSFTTDTVDEVREFLADHPMEYSSFIDKEGETMIRYMALDNRNTIPHAFLFDTKGILVWIGNPLDNLESRVKGVLDGTLNADHAVAVRDAQAALQTAFESQSVDGMLDSLRELEKLEPDNFQYYQVHYQILTQMGFGDPTEVQELFQAWYQGCQDQPQALVILALVALDQGAPEQRNPELALAAAKRAFSLETPMKSQAGLGLAEVYKSIGRLDRAIATIQEVATLVEPDQMEIVTSIEDFYRRLQELGENPDVDYTP